MYGKKVEVKPASGDELTASLLIERRERKPKKPAVLEVVNVDEPVQPIKVISNVTKVAKKVIEPEPIVTHEETAEPLETVFTEQISTPVVKTDPEESAEAEKSLSKEIEKPVRSTPIISKKVLKWTSFFGMAALGVIGGGSLVNYKVFPNLEESKAVTEFSENRGLMIKVIDQTTLAMSLMREDGSAISTRKKISLYYDAPKNLFYSKIGLDKERFSEKLLEFEGRLFLNNRATGEGNVWFNDRQILVSLDNYEGSLPDNRCNIPGVPKSNCLTGFVLFDLYFENGQISSVYFSTLVGNKNASNADSSGEIGTVNAGKRSLGISLNDADLLSRIKALYNSYLLMKRATIAKKEGDSSNPTKSETFQRKLLDGSVVYDFVSSNGNRDSCAGFVYASDVIVTAKHCLAGSKNDTNGALLENVMSINKDKSDVVRQSSVWSRGSGKYQYAFSGYKDLGVIVFDRAALTKAKPLGISEKIITEDDKFIFGHVVRTDGKKYWRSEIGTALTQRDNYDLNDPYWLKFAFGLQKGNSGGATVDSNGDVVSVLRNYCDYDEATSNGKFCGDRVTKKDVITLIAEARKKLTEIDK